MKDQDQDQDRLAVLFKSVEDHISAMSENIDFDDFDGAAIVIQQCYFAQLKLAEINAMIAQNTMKALCEHQHGTP